MSLRAALVLVTIAWTAALAGGCGGNDSPSAAAHDIEFTDVSRDAGIQFDHWYGGIGRRHLPECMGGSAAWFDLDRDGDMDLFLGQSGPLSDTGPTEVPPKNGLYRNNGDGTFTDITDSSGDAIYTGYGQGVAAGDFDGDGYCDLLVANYGPNVLLRNRGDGSFEDATERAGLADDDDWGCSAAFFDMEGDGDLDLYVVNYVRFAMDDYRTKTRTGKAFLAYPHPDKFRASPDYLYRNNGDGTFTEVSLQVGVKDVDGKGLGVAAVDLDRDGDLDLYVSNDSTPNFVYRNNGDGSFTDMTTLSNAGYNADGRTEAGMGIAVGDVDGDLRQDIFVTNLDAETNTLYMNIDDFYFEDMTRARGLALDSVVFVGFGTGFLDVDLDSDLDLFVANGHIVDNIEEFDSGAGSTYLQRVLFFENDGSGQFSELTDRICPDLAVERTVRAMAMSDYDNDGDVDAVMVQNGAPAVLLRNDSRRKGHFLSIRAIDAEGRDSYGASCVVEANGKRAYYQSIPAASYCASHDPRIIVGTAVQEIDSLELLWVTGERVVLKKVETDRHIRVAPDGTVEAEATE